MFDQYSIENYRIDLYFPDYKIAIECDEHNHKYQISEDIIRQEIISNKLDCIFIRYRPYDKDFDIYNVINEIYVKIREKILNNHNIKK